MVTSKRGAAFICTHARYKVERPYSIFPRYTCITCDVSFSSLDQLKKSRDKAIEAFHNRSKSK